MRRFVWGKNLGRFAGRVATTSRGVRGRGVATAVSIAILGSLMAVPAQAAATAQVKAPAVSGVKSVTDPTPVPIKKNLLVNHPAPVFHADATAWPAATSGTALAAAPGTGRQAGSRVQVSGTPIWVQRLASSTAAKNATGTRASSAASATASTGRVAVKVLAHSAAAPMGVDGVVFSLSGPSSSKLGVGLDYASYAQAYGGNFASRLRLVELPACALTTPQLAACRRQTPLPSSIDYATTSVSTQLSLPAAATAASTKSAAAAVPAQAPVTSELLAATDSTGEEGTAAGSYAATALAPSGSWTSGGSSGSWDYTYPVTLPSASTSLTPSVDLSYDSGSVDGQTSSTQAQSSWIGDGWSTSDSYIAQTFTPCDDDPEGTAALTSTYDECYAGQVLTLSLNGQSTQLVPDGTKGGYKLADDDGATVSQVTSSGNGNGTYDTDYWVVTESSGVKYEFGLNELPSWKTGDPTTNSVDTEPVYSAHPGDPCYSTSGFTSSVCTMAYQWNLDYVVAPDKSAMAYYYDQATNYYGQDNGADNGAKSAPYVRDSYLDHIDYGFQDGGAYSIVPDKVVYGTSVRCVATTCGSLSSISAATASSEYPDVPFDLLCAKGATCTAYGPSFFSTVRLTQITTEQYSTTSSKPVAVDTYNLTQTEPASGDGLSPTLFLSGINHIGDDTSAGGSTAASAPLTTAFAGTDLQNRVDLSAYPGLYRWRINKVTTETGEVIGITYELPDPCTASSIASITPSSNTSSCYPVYWTKPDNAAPIEDWFEKYAVAQVLETDTTGGALNEETDYKYPGAPAWHYDDDEVVKAKYRTGGQFRGYASVETLTGAAANNPQTESTTSYYQGMDGDYLTASTTRSVTLTDSQGGKHTDSDQLSGQALETTTYLGAGGPVDHSTINSYWVSAPVATRTRTGLPDLTANATGLAEAWTRQADTDGGTTTWSDTEIDTTYDATTTDADFGLATHSYKHTVPANPAYSQCTTITYTAPNTTSNLVGLVAETETDSVACSGFTEGSASSAPAALNTLGAPSSVTAAQVVSATQTLYDDPSFSTTFPQAAAPTEGLVTMVRKASGGAPGSFTWQTESRSTYDAYGHVADSYDADGNETITATTYNSAGLATGAKVTNALTQSTTTTLDPTRGLTLTSTDPNGVVTTTYYDALGRLVDVWKDSRATTTPANTIYTYTVSDDSLSGVTTQTLNDELGYATSVTIDDSLGRVRQTQTPTAKGGRLITDTFYDSRGWVYKKNTNYWDSTTTPTITGPLYSWPDYQVPDQDQYTLDGLDRTVVDTSLDDSQVKSTTTTVYNGDTTTVIPPTGGTVTATSTDPFGRTTSVSQYTTAPTLNTPSNTFNGIWSVTNGTQDTTSYGYDGHGNQNTTSNAGSTWTSVYNLLGQITSKTDPDAGTSTMVYDPDGNLLQSQNADGNDTSTTYDALGRKLATYDAPTNGQTAYTSTTSPGNETASWVYDNANDVSGVTDAVGQTTTETAYNNGYPYVTQSLGFNVFGESLGTSVTVPSGAQNSALAKTWTIKHGYSLNTGLLASDTYPAGDGLPLETVLHGYATALDLPNSLASSYGYSQSTTYDAYGNVDQQTLGSGTNEAYVTDSYDSHTNALTDQLVTRSTNPADVDDEAYTYNADQQTTSSTDTRLGSAATSETQCYTYDAQDRLDAAWTATDDCAATPSTGSDSTVGDNLGTADAYWSTWTFTPTGQRATETDYATGTTAVTATTTTTDAYNGNSTGQAHTLTSTSSTGGSTASTAYAYDADGNMTTRTTPATGTQNLTWNNQDQLTTVTGSTAGNASYLYDADGNLLVQTDGANTTLYVAGEEITYNSTTPATTALRYYALPGGGTVVRNAAGSNYAFEITNQQGTSSLYLDSTCQTPTWRQFTPYGAPRGTTTTWVDNRGFLNQPTDTTTGLTLDGARNYDPTTGAFISLDPLFEATDTQELNGYSYSANNPIDGSDPTGQAEMLPDTESSSAPCSDWCSPSFEPQHHVTWTNVVHYAANATASTVNSLLATGETAGAISTLGTSLFYDHYVVNPFINKLEHAASVNQNSAEYQTTSLISTVLALPDLGPDDALEGLSGCLNSFAPDTPVLMADGKTKPIKTIKVGDKVESANPANGKPEGARPVTATIVNHDNNLLDVTVSTGHGHTATIHTTTEHPFWDATTHTWVDAAKLIPGHTLASTTPTSHPVVLAIKPTPGAANRFNLTIQQLHTYYVLAGTTPILVHNCNTNIPNVALGTEDNGLVKFADDNKYTHFMGQTREDALANVRDVANNHPETQIHVRLDGFKMTSGEAGATNAQLFDDAVSQGQGDNWFTTQREMAILERAYRMGNLDTSRLTFYMEGKDVTSEVLAGSNYLGGS